MDRARFNAWLVSAERRPLVMGVLNVTPDSFSDGGQYAETAAAIAHGEAMMDEGADLIDIGAESTRPGALPVPAAEQIGRVVPVIEHLARARGIALSIDTTRAAVAEAALEAGAAIVNDVSAGRDDPELLPLAASRSVPMILMHMLGTPRTMQLNPVYRDVTAEVATFLHDRMEAAVAAGVRLEQILIDPGIGFGKTMEHNLQLLRDLKVVADLGRPVVVGTSRKRFIGAITGETEPAHRLFGTAATIGWSIAQGAAIVRVHDVKPMAQVVAMVRAIMERDQKD